MEKRYVATYSDPEGHFFYRVHAIIDGARISFTLEQYDSEDGMMVQADNTNGGFSRFK